MIRISTTDKTAEVSFPTEGEITLQLITPFIEVQVSVEVSTDGTTYEKIFTLGSLYPDNKIVRLPHYPNIRLKVLNNRVGELLEVRSDV